MKETFREEESHPAEQKASTGTGMGPKGLEAARTRLLEEQGSRKLTRIQQGAYEELTWVVEGKLDGQTVYREKSPEGNLPKNIDMIPEGKEEEVVWSVAGYRG